ncbi:MAG: carboxypeptidase regulatory-like domain-containing protein [Planctomycetes bacterium]|nr:carboxypeptidase regulatory-like domain-containing protein [Planctomycetota bacterium]
MTPLFTSFAHWLADYYLLSTVLLVLAVAALVAVKQPAKRRAVTQSTLIGLVLLAALCALPGWSLMSLTSNRPTASLNIQTIEQPASPPLPIREGPGKGSSPPDFHTMAGNTSPAVNTSVPPPQPPRRHLPWSSLAVFAWCAGAALALLRLAIGWWAARRLFHNAQPAPANLVTMLREVLTNHDKHAQTPLLLTSAEIDVAVALGIRRPAVLLPTKWLQTQTTDDLHTVLAHEAAHIHNRDLQWLALSRALNVLLWAQPLYWFVRRRMRLDQEALADAAAAELTSRQHYAEQLVAWAHVVSARPTPRLSSAVGLWESPSQLRARIALLIDSQFTVLRSCTRSWRIAAALLAATSALALSTITLQPPRRADAQDQPAERDPKPLAARSNDPTAPDSIPQLRPNTFAGRAVDENGKPVVGVGVFLFRTKHSDASRKLVSQKATDADGRFQFDNVIDIAKEFPDGKFPPEHDVGAEFLQVIVRSPGRVTQHMMQTRQHIAQWGEFREMKLPPAAILRGRITSPDGKPVAGALVSFGTLGTATWDGAMAARTDENGNYEIDDIAPFDMQQYRDQIAEQQRQAQEKGRKDVYSAALFISPPFLRVEHPDFAVMRIGVEKVPGEKAVQLEPAAILEGRVVYGPSGEPAAGALVEAITSVAKVRQVAPEQFTSMHRAVTRTGPDGTYRFTTMPAGTYDLSATMDGWVNAGINELVTNAGKSVSAPDLTLSKGGVISIRLVDSKSGEPIDVPLDTTAAIAAHKFPLQALSRPVHEPFAAANADKRFELRAPAGKRLLMVSGVRVGNEIKWLGAAQLGEDSRIMVDVVEGETVEVDVPVTEAEEGTKASGVAMDRVEVRPLNVRQNPREAIESLSKTLQEQADNVRALLDRALAFETVGEHGNAMADYEKVIELKSDGIGNLIAHNNLAYLLSTAPDDSIRNGKRAVELAKKAQQLSTEPMPDIVDTLAAAYAEAGDFDEAVKAQQQAIEMKPDNSKFREHLKLYQAKQPLRDDRGASERPKGNAADEKEQSRSGPILRGRIIDDAGKPIPGVEIILYGGIATRFRGQETKTNENGEYEFKPLETGAAMARSDNDGPWLYTGIQFKHPEMVPADGKSWRDLRVLNKKEHVEELNLTMTRGGKISGVVLHPDSDQPVPKLDLRIYNGFDEGKETGDFHVYATTGDDGSFTSEPLFPGRYVIDINDNNFAGQSPYPKIGHADVRPGETTNLRISTRELLELQDPFQITGTAIGDDGKSMVYGGVGVLINGGKTNLRSRGGGIDGRNVFGIKFGPVERSEPSENSPYGVGTHDIDLVGNNQRVGYTLIKRTPSEPLRITDDPNKPEVEDGIRYIRPNQPVEFKLIFAKEKQTPRP